MCGLNKFPKKYSKMFFPSWVGLPHPTPAVPLLFFPPYRYFHAPMLGLGELTFPNFWAAQTKVFNPGIDPTSSSDPSASLSTKWGEGSPAKGSSHKEDQGGIDLKGEPGLYIFPALWNQPPLSNGGIFGFIGEFEFTPFYFQQGAVLIICIGGFSWAISKVKSLSVVTNWYWCNTLINIKVSCKLGRACLSNLIQIQIQIQI